MKILPCILTDATRIRATPPLRRIQGATCGFTLDSLPARSPSSLNLYSVNQARSVLAMYLILCGGRGSGPSRRSADAESAIRARFVPDSFQSLPKALIPRTLRVRPSRFEPWGRHAVFSDELSSGRR